MASIVEKYEQIFASDPKSRIFVELARALLERGEAERAIDVCRRGLEHHPSSILGRVIWGRALLEQNHRKAAIDQFEIAIALDPGSPYAFNLVGEALLAKDLPREALPVLARAAELQPADERVRAWLAEAKRRATGDPPPPPPRRRAPAIGDDEKTEPYRPLPARAPPAGGEDAEVIADDPFALATAREQEPEVAAEPPADAPAVPTRPPSAPAAATSPQPVPPRAAPPVIPPVTTADDAEPGPGLEAAPHSDTPLATAPPPVSRRSKDPDAVTDRTLPTLGAPRPPPLRTSPLPNAPSPPGPPVTPAPPPLPPPSLLDLVPGRTGTFAAARVAAPPPVAERTPDEAEAERIAARYADEVRQRMLAEGTPRKAPAGRRTLVVIAVAVAFSAAGGVFYALASARSADLARTALTRARAGLARDTVGSLREASALLAEARRRSPEDPGLLSLSAQVAGLLAADHGDAPSLALAQELVGSGRGGDGAVAARYLLARTGPDRAEAEAAVLEARPSSPALVQTLAGEALLTRGELDSGRGRLEIAARSSPPMLRALADLGDSALATGDPEGALDFFAPALQAHATHPRSVVGAAEARLALGRELAEARRQLEAVEADAASAPPAALRPRFEVAFARVLAALGDSQAAATRLGAAQQALGESVLLASALAEVQLSARAWDRAEAAAARAVALDGKDPGARVLLARARIGRGHPEDALQVLAGRTERPARVQRAVALIRLGKPAEARAELERTVRDGRMPADAAVWYALADVALGRADRARPLLERLAAASTPPPFAAVALGRACQALGDLAAAEKAFRAAIERDPRAPEGHAGLGRLLAARGDLPGALAALGEAVKRDPSDLDVRRALGEVRLASGQPGAARAELDAVLLAHPDDASALSLVSAAWLAEGQPSEARRSAERAVAAAPRSPEALLAAARASLAAGDRAAARAYAERAIKAGGKGDEASKVLAEAGGGGKPATKAPAKGAKKKR